MSTRLLKNQQPTLICIVSSGCKFDTDSFKTGQSTTDVQNVNTLSVVVNGRFRWLLVTITRLAYCFKLIPASIKHPYMQQMGLLNALVQQGVQSGQHDFYVIPHIGSQLAINHAVPQ